MSAQERYSAALAAEDWDTAEAILRQGLAQSGDPQILLMLGAFLRKRGRFAAAEAVLAPAADTAPTPEILDFLALTQYEQQKFADCEKTLERLVALTPAAALGTYLFLAKVKATRLGPDGGRDVMRRALEAHPGSTEFVASYADTLSPEEAIAALERHLGDVHGDPGRTAYVLIRIAAHRAPILRKLRGLPMFGASWPDTIQWPDPESLPALKQALLAEIAMGSRRAAARYDLASLLISEGAWSEAQRYLVEMRETSKRTPADFTAFGEEFHAGLDAMSRPEIVGGLVAVKRLRASPAQRDEPGAGETVFMASDPTYFTRFTLPFLRQLEAMNIPLSVHVHLLDGEERAWKDANDALGTLNIVNVSLTAEASGAAAIGRSHARYYYHAVRYVRFYEELRRANRPMWVFDCDVQLMSDPRPLLASLRDYDVALRTTPTSLGPLLKITASCVGIMPSERGHEFARRVAAYIIHWKDRGTWGWGVDQAALLSSYAHMSDQGRMPKTLFLDDCPTSEKPGDTRAIRFMPGIGKYFAPPDAASEP